MEILDKVMSKVSKGSNLTPKEKKVLKNAIDAGKGEANTKASDALFNKIRKGVALSSTDKKLLSTILDASQKETNEENLSEEISSRIKKRLINKLNNDEKLSDKETKKLQDLLSKYEGEVEQKVVNSLSSALAQGVGLTKNEKKRVAKMLNEETNINEEYKPIKYLQKIIKDKSFSRDTITNARDILDDLKNKEKRSAINFCKKVVKEGEPSWNEDTVAMCNELLNIFRKSMNESTINEMALRHVESIKKETWDKAEAGDKNAVKKIANAYINKAQEEGMEDKKIISSLGPTFKKNTVKVDGEKQEYSTAVPAVKAAIRENLGFSSTPKSKTAKDKKELPPSKIKDAAAKAGKVMGKSKDEGNAKVEKDKDGVLTVKEDMLKFAGILEACGKDHKKYSTKTKSKITSEDRNKIKKYRRLREFRSSLDKAELKKFEKMKKELQEKGLVNSKGTVVA